MAIRTYDILLDSYNSTMPEPIVGRQGDKNGAVTLHVTITDRGTTVDLTDQTVNLMAETANGTAVIADNAGVTLTDAVSGKFDYAIPNALWSEAGKITKAYFSLNDTDGQETTYDLIFIVKKAIDISQDKADDYVTVIDGTIRDLKTKVDAIYADFSAGNFYNKDQVDTLNNDLKTSISDSEESAKSFVDDKVVFSTVDETNSGEEKEKIVSPQTLNRFNEDKNKTYFSIKSLSDLSSNFQYTASEAFLVFKRTGNMVNLYGRVNISNLYTNGSTYSPLISIPDGFKLSTEFNNMVWNVSISASIFQAPISSPTGAFAERQATNLIRFSGSHTGNHYLSGSWYTDDDVPGWYQEENTRLSAHRGNTALAPENTLEAFQSAIDSNFGAVELDPRLSSDGELFIMHDDTVDRTTDGTGKIEELTAEQIKNLTIDTTGYSQYAGKTLRVPSLDESIETLAAGDMIVNIDGSKIDLSVKTTADAIVSILNKYNMFNRVFFVMSDSTQRDAFLSMYPDAVVSWLQESSGGISSGITKAKTYTHAFISIPLSIATEDNIETIKESGLFLQVYGVDNMTDLVRLRKDHVYLIETDGVS